MKNNKQQQIAQGDVLLVPVEEVPGDAIFQKDRTVVAYGEATGHAHRFAVKLADDVEMFDSAGTLYIKVNRATPIQHEEHNVWKNSSGTTIETPMIPPGIYRFAPQRMWDPWLEEARRVQD